MSAFELIGFFWTVLSVAATTLAVAYFSWRGVRDLKHQVEIGERLKRDLKLSATEIDRITSKEV